MKRTPTSGGGRAVAVVAAGEQIVQRGQHFAQRWAGAWTDYTTRVFSVSRAAASSRCSLPAFLQECAAAAAEGWGTAFDAGGALLSGICGCPRGSIVLAFDPDAEMAGPSALSLPYPPNASPEPSDLVQASTGATIPSAHVRARVEGATLKVTLVDLKPLFGPPLALVPGEYTGEIDLGGGVPIAVTANYGGECSATGGCCEFAWPCFQVRIGCCDSAP